VTSPSLASLPCPATPDQFTEFLAAHDIAVQRRDHEAVFTVEESVGLRGTIPGAHSKNLFLKDKKGRLFLVSAREDARIDLKRLHEVIGASGRLSFCSGEALMEKLGVTPGSVTAFAIINDRAGDVTMVLDANLARAPLVNFHPLTNTATLSITTPDLMRFFALASHAPLIVDLPVPPDGQNA
jgi:Ala-tRNA(Pro) deacylase